LKHIGRILQPTNFLSFNDVEREYTNEESKPSIVSLELGNIGMQNEEDSLKKKQ